MPEDPSALSVAEIGSFFVGGHIHRLEGLAKRERISTPGGPVHFIDPNGELMAGQMYVQYVRLAKPSAAAPLGLYSTRFASEASSLLLYADIERPRCYLLPWCSASGPGTFTMISVPGSSASPRSAPVAEKSRALVETKKKRVLVSAGTPLLKMKVYLLSYA